MGERHGNTNVRAGGGGGKTLLLTLALLALAAAAFAAIIAADFSTAQAQNDDETAGRIVARLLDDGRVEFGWQPSGGERVLPRQRYFPNDITHNRWLRSSPVEVNGAEIGRINARLLEDGRIEFAFTPTDGERITPQARYFPADARENRWLRSTEIAIGPAAPRYTAISAGFAHTCAIRAGTGAIECWGADGYDYRTGEFYVETGQTKAPEGSYSAIAASYAHTCAIRASEEIECWGISEGSQHYDTYYLGETDAPEGSYSAISAGATTCAIRASDSAIECWGGGNHFGQADAPEGSYSAISAGGAHTCAIRTSGEIDCWGNNYYGQTDAPEGSYSAISAGGVHTCAIRASDSTIACWGWNDSGQTDAPEGSYTTITGRQGHTCAIRAGTGAIECWGANGFDTEEGYIEIGQTDAPENGSYATISAGYTHTCAIRESGEIDCWGENEHGQATPPTD